MTYENLVQQYYVGFYGRPADKEGLDYWTAKVDEANGDFTEIQDAFANSAEYENFVLTDADGDQRSYEELVNFIYNNLFGRDAEEEGLNYYVEGLEDGTFTLVSIVQNIIDGAESGSTDKAVFQNRLQIAQSFTDGVYDNFKMYQAEDILDARGVLYLVDESGNSLSNALGAANSWISQQEFRPIDPPTADTTFTLERIDPTVHSETDTKLMWGEGDQMLSACAMLSYLEDLVGNDLFDWSIVGQDAHGVLGPNDAAIFLEQFENKNISIREKQTIVRDEDGNPVFDEDGDSIFELIIEETDTGSITTHQFTASYQYMEFVQRLLWGEKVYEYGEDYVLDEEGEILLDGDDNPVTETVITGESYAGGLLFDSEGNIRIWEWSNENQEITYYANILTPETSFGVFESGYTTDADDLIVAGRPELLHGAYIDGGGGFNTLAVDMKGPFAQPLQLLNIQKVSIQNLPNIYDDFWGDRYGDGSGSYDRVDQNLPEDQLPDDYDGNYEGGYGTQTENFPYPFPNHIQGTTDSVLDLSRAVHLKQLVITESTDFFSHDQVDPGSLTIAGIRNGVTAELDGGFTQSVFLHYGAIQATGVDLKLSNLNMENELHIAQNSDTLNIESTGGGNWLEYGYLGGQLTNLNVTGDAHLYIEGNLDPSFHDGNPATIDASQNTGGVNLHLDNSSDKVTFTGTESADDRFSADGNTASTTVGVIINGGDGDNMFSAVGADNQVQITAGDGNNQIDASSAEDVTVTTGEGNSVIDVASTNSVATVTTGDGDNTIEASNSKDVVVQTGSGDDDITTLNNETVDIDAGDGDNVMTVRASDAKVTAGAGDDTLTLSGRGGSQVQDVDGANLMFFFDLSGSMADSDIQATLNAANAVLDNLTNQGIDTAVRLIAFGSTAQSEFNGTDAWMDISTAQSFLTLAQMQNMPQYSGGTDFEDAVDAGMAAFSSGQGSVFNSSGLNASFFFSDGGSSFSTAKQTEWEAFLNQNDILSNALGFGSATISGLEPIAYDGITGNDISPILSADPDDLTDDILDLLGSIEIAGGSEALIDIDLGGGANTIELGNGDDLPGLTAYQGSKIAGENITLIVNGDSDLQAVDMTGADIASVVLDDGSPSANRMVENAMLTLTAGQFEAIGAENFSVEGSVFHTHAYIKLIVDQDLDLSDIDVGSLPRNIDLYLELQDEVTLTLSAEQLHRWVAQEGITIANDGNTDYVSGKVVIEGGGTDFDPFNTSDTVNTIIGGNVYYGGSLSDDFMVDGEWFNVTVNSDVNGFDRPSDDPAQIVLTLDTSADGFDGEQGEFSSWHTQLEIVGENEITFTGPIELGMRLGEPEKPYTVEFSGLEAVATDLTLAHFEMLAQGGGVHGNGNNGYASEVLIHIAADDDSDGIGWDEDDADALVSTGVERYIVTEIEGPTAPGSPGSTATIKLSDPTQDVEVFGLRGNYNDTLVIQDAAWGLAFELQGGGTAKAEGPTGTSNVGALVANYMWPGADAVVDILHSVDGDTRPLYVAGIDIDNAETITINAAGPAVTIASLSGNEVADLSFAAAGDIVVEGDLPLTVTTIDAGDVEGTFTAMIDGIQASGSVDDDYAFTFTGAQGGSYLVLEDLAEGEYVIDGGAAGVELTIQDEVDLTEATLTNVTGVTLTDGSTLNINMADADAIGAANFAIAEEGDAANLNLEDFDGEPFAIENYPEEYTISLTLADDPVITLHPDTDLTGIAALDVPEGTVLNLTAAQFNQLTTGVITGDGSVNITDLTQADVEDGFDLTGITAENGTITMAEDIELAAGDDLGDFEVVIGDDMTLTLADISQADGLVIGGGTNTTLKFTDTSAGMFESIDASGFNIDTLMILNVLVADRNVDLMFQGLPEGVTKVIYNDLGWVEGLTQYVVIEEGTTVPGFLVFNRPEAETEIRHFDLTLEGGTEIEGNLRLSQSDNESGMLQVDLQSVTIHSNGDAENLITGETANIIRGDITSQGTGPQGTYTSEPNDLLNVTINAEQDFILQGQLIFESVVASEYDDGITANDDYNATATLNVDGPADVTIADLDTSDDEVVELVINHTGDGALTVGLSSLTSIDDDDEIIFNGSATGMDTIVMSGVVDLSDDTLVNVDAIVIDETGAFGGAGGNDPELTLSQEQLDDIGPGSITVDEQTGQTSTLNIVELGSDPFDATALDEEIDIVNIFTAEGNVTLDPSTNLTGVDMITVPEGSTLNLTAEQYQQLDGTGTIVGIDDDGNASTDITVNITDLYQADVDLGFDLSGVAADNLSVTLAEDVYLAATDDLNNAEVNVGDTLTLGLADWTQADGLIVNGGTDSTVIYQFDSVPTVFTQIDASGYDITTLKALATFVGGNNAEFTIDDLPSSVVLQLYQDPEDLGFLSPTYRSVFIEEGVYVPVNIFGDSLIFNDWDEGDEVLTLAVTMDGDVEVDGDISLPTRTDKDPDLVQRYFQTLTLTSQGDDPNVINGGINTQPSLLIPDNTDENNLMNIVIHAFQDLSILDAVEFNHTAGTDTVADLLITGDADVSIKALDTTDATITGLTINNAGTGTLTVTGGSDALELDNTETLVLEGTGDIVLDTDNGAGNNGIEGNDLSSINAADLEGNLTVGVVEDIDDNDFEFIAGTGTTTMTLIDDDLDSTGTDAIPGNADDTSGWTFDFSSADTGSEFRLNFDGTGLVDGSILNIDLGANTTLYIDQSMDLSDLDLSIIQTLSIVVADGATLTLSAAQADGLDIIGESGGASTGQVDIVDLGENPVDLSGIDEAIAGYVSMGTTGTEDVTLDSTTDLGYFTVALQPNDPGDLNLSGQTIRFTTIEQAERAIEVFKDAEARTSWDVPGDDTNNTNSTNVAWLFNSVPDALDTSDYDANIGRVWVSAALVDSVGGDIEQLWTTLANSIIRVDFNSVTELDILLASNPVDRVMELTSFTDITGLIEVDDGISPEEHIETLTVEMGGEVTVGDIVIGDVVAAPDTDPTTPEFNELTLNSRVALHDGHFLATEDYVNNNDGVADSGETVMPVLYNTVGDIGVGGSNPGIDLLNVTINTFGAAIPGGGLQTIGTPGPANGTDGAEFFFGTLVYDAETAGSTANFTVTGENDVTGKALDLSDPEIGAFSLDVSAFDPGANLTFTGGSPALDGSMNLEFVNIDTGDLPPMIPVNGINTVRFGYIYDEATDEFIIHRDGNDDPYSGIYSPELSELNVSGIGNHSVHFGYLAAIDSNDDDTDDDGVPDQNAFTLIGNGNDLGVTPVTTAILGEAVVNGSLTAPELESGSTWRFENAVITLADTAVLNPGAILEFEDAVLVIDGDVDLSEIDLSLVNTTIEVVDGSSLTLTVTQANDLTDDVTGSGTVKLVDDADTGDDANALHGTSLDFVKTVGVDLSALTGDGSPVGPLNLPGAIDDDGTDVGHDFIGTDFDDIVNLSNEGDTVTGGPGDDSYTGGTGDDTFNVDEDTDTIIGLETGDILVVSNGATAVAGGIDEFIATSETANDGTALLTALAAGETTIDVSLAGGDEGFTLTAEANASGQNGRKILIGSDNDDVINAGDSFQDAANRADVLTGNGGNDLFEFNISIAETADMIITPVTDGVDEEELQVAAGGDRTSYTLNINYELNGVANNLTLNSSDIAGDINDVNDIAAAIAGFLDALNGIYASSAADTVIVGGDGINGFEFVGSEVSVINSSGGATDPSFGPATEPGTDTAQVTEIEIDDSVNTPNEGDIYSILTTLANGQNIGVSYEVQSGDQADDVAAGLVTQFNLVAPAFTISANHTPGDKFLTLTDEVPDNGGFSVVVSEQGAIDGTGASKLLTGTETMLADAYADVITDFTTGEDKISLGIVDGTFGNYFEDGGQANFADAYAEANNQFDGTKIYYLTSTPDDEGLLFFDANADGNADGVLQLLGVNNLGFDYTDIVE